MSHPQLHLISLDKSIDIKVDMGDGPATPTAGFSGYESVSRVRKTAMTAFVGTAPFAQDVPVFLDGYREDRSIERKLEELLSLGGATKFMAYGPIHQEGGPYIFGDEPEFGEAIRAEDGTLLRQALTLKLEEFVSADEAGRRKGPKIGLGQGVPVEYTTGADDTLEKVAFKVYHDASRAKEIGEKQRKPIRNVHRVLPQGTELIL